PDGGATARGHLAAPERPAADVRPGAVPVGTFRQMVASLAWPTNLSPGRGRGCAGCAGVGGRRRGLPAARGGPGARRQRGVHAPLSDGAVRSGVTARERFTEGGGRTPGQGGPVAGRNGRRARGEGGTATTAGEVAPGDGRPEGGEGVERPGRGSAGRDGGR